MTDWTTADIPDQTGRTAVITGANTGLGFETAKALAAKGAHVVIAVRNTDKGKQAAAQMSGDVEVQELDLTSLDSISSAADALKGRYERIDLLINNAGVMTTPKGTTADGFELQFGTNHLGHFAFTGLLLDEDARRPGLPRRDREQQRTQDGRRHPLRRSAVGAQVQPDRRLQPVEAGQPVVHLRTQRRLAPRGKAIAVAAHPGTAITELGRIPAFRGPARLSCRLPGCSPRAPTGAPCRPCVPPPTPAFSAVSTTGPTASASSAATRSSSRPAPSPTTLDLQRRLWAVSEELTKVQFPIG